LDAVPNDTLDEHIEGFKRNIRADIVKTNVS